MKSLFATLLISIFLLTSCGNPTDNSQVYIGAEAGPADITVAINNNGQVSVSGGVAPKFKVGLGPVELKIGIQKTLELTKEKQFTLFIIWEDENGEIQREEYEIGKTFNVKFSQNELIQEIQGDNNSVIVVVKKPKQGLSSTSETIGIPFYISEDDNLFSVAGIFQGKYSVGTNSIEVLIDSASIIYRDMGQSYDGRDRLDYFYIGLYSPTENCGKFKSPEVPIGVILKRGERYTFPSSVSTKIPIDSSVDLSKCQFLFVIASTSLDMNPEQAGYSPIFSKENLVTK